MVASLKVAYWLGFSVDVFLLSFCADNACNCFLVVANQWGSFARALLLSIKQRAVGRGFWWSQWERQCALRAAKAGAIWSGFALQSFCLRSIWDNSQAESANLVPSAAGYSEFRKRTCKGRSYTVRTALWSTQLRMFSDVVREYSRICLPWVGSHMGLPGMWAAW